MSSLLALASAGLFGVGDFAGGLAARRAAPIRVAAWSQVVGLPVLAVGLLVVPARLVTPADLLWGAVAGLAGLVGIVLLYGSLAAGTMSVVAPITGVVAASLPVVVDLVAGARLDGRQWLGVGLAVTAIALLSGGGRGSLTPRLVGRAVAAGVAFAGFFVALSTTSVDAGLWPLAGARMASVPVALALAARAGGGRLDPIARRLVVVAGGFDQAANLAVGLALQRGPLGIAAVLSSLYPAVTALMAVAVLAERPGRYEALGIGLAVGAAVLLA